MLKKDYDKKKRELKKNNQFLPDISKYHDNQITDTAINKNINTSQLLNEQRLNDNLITLLGIIIFIAILIIV